MLAEDLNPHMHIRALSPARDVPVIHPWFGMDYAHFWNMQDLSLAQILQFYEDMQASGHASAHLGLYRGLPAFVVECYDPSTEPVGEHYPVQPGDMGMHFFVGPAATPVRHFTRDVLRAVMAFMFHQLGATRVVVEPDSRNDKVHLLNKAVGFVYDRQIQLPLKKASLAFCTRSGFELSIQGD
jgi:hypothetical protein